MRSFSEREKLIGQMCGIVLLGCLFYYAVGRPLKRIQTDLKEKIDLDERLLKKNIDTIETSYLIPKGYNEYLDLFSQKKSDGQEMSRIILEIEAAASQMNVRLSEIQPHKIQKKDFYNVFSVTLLMEGHLSQITQFIYLLQNRPYLLEVNELRLERESAADPSLQVHMVLSRRLIVKN